MGGWQNPSALWAMVLVGLPVIVHLLRTHQAKRVLFPSLRFVQPSRSAAVRLRLPSDLMLMFLRMAIVASVAAGLAAPIVLTSSRLAAWDSRMARAIVVDASESMRLQDSGGRAPAAAASEAAEAERRSAAFSSTFTVTHLDEGVRRAARWLETQPPARREVVVISDLQRGAVDDSVAKTLGQSVGLRFIQVGHPQPRLEFDGVPLLHSGASRKQRVEATADSTSVVIEPAAGTGSVGLRVLAEPGAEQKIARLLRAVATAGASAGAADQPIAIRLSGAPVSEPGPLTPIKSGWMLHTVLRMRADESLTAPTVEDTAVRRSDERAGDYWTTIAGDSKGWRVRAAAADRELVVDVAATVDDIFAARVTRAVLNARVDASVYDEREVGRVDEGAIAALTRRPGPVEPGAWRTAEVTDARWCWLIAVVLLLVEQWLRSRTARPAVEEVPRAAA